MAEVVHESLNDDYEMSSMAAESIQTIDSGSAAPAYQPEPQDGANVQELPAVDGGRKAWTFCVSAFILETMVWGFGFSYGIFQDYYTSHPPFNTASPVAIAAVGTTSIAIQYAECLLLSFFFGRYPDMITRYMWGGLGLAVISLFISSFATKVWQLILLQGVLFGIGAGLLYFPVILLLPQWFVRRRGLAGGIIFAGSGVGGFAFPFVLNALLSRTGYAWTLRAWSLCMLLVSGIALLGLRPRVPVAKFQPGQPRPRFIPPGLEFLENPLFYAFAVTNIIQALSYFPVSLYIATFTKSVGSPLSATIVLSLFNSSGVVGQILIGHLSDRFPYPWIMFVSALGSGIAAFLLWGFATTLAQVLAFAIVFGGLSGGFSSIWPVAAADCAGSKPEHAGITFGSTALCKGVAAVIGPIISGILYEAGRSSTQGHARYGSFGFGTVEIFVGTCAIATSIGSILVAATRNGTLRIPRAARA
ncbi:MFS general substrate transporter [Obba rivulosa]|uniref:MFS general substrate transporter n=1 Tax=Obba rivulosa TaxID=1052685 RepID=A0A8E2AY18_9APHY|nr:MFS general substrate transporter [Obba rivulosa]